MKQATFARKHSEAMFISDSEEEDIGGDYSGSPFSSNNGQLPPDASHYVDAQNSSNSLHLDSYPPESITDDDVILNKGVGETEYDPNVHQPAEEPELDTPDMDLEDIQEAISGLPPSPPSSVTEELPPSSGSWRSEPDADEISIGDLGMSDVLPPLLPIGSNWELDAARLRRTQPMNESDFRYLRHYNFQSKIQMGARAFEIWRQDYPENQIPSLKVLEARMRMLSGIDFRKYDCCRRSCICFVGEYAECDSCPVCKLPRWHPNSREAYSEFKYLPILPQLKAAYASSKMAKAMRYRSEVQDDHKHDPNDTISDIYHSALVRMLRKSPVMVHDQILPFNYFDDDRDVLLVMMTDGFNIFKRGKHTSWPLIFLNSNLPPSMRFNVANVICAGVIPGPKKPKNFGTFMYIIAQELAQAALGELAYDALKDEEFSLRAYCPYGAGDMPAGDCAYTEGKGANGLAPCRCCEIRGVKIIGAPHHTHYIPISRPTGYPAHPPGLTAANLPLRTHEGYLAQARTVELADTRTRSEDLAKWYGVNGTPMTSFIPGVRFPFSFPFDLMHLVENLLKNYASLISGDFKGLDHGQLYVIPDQEWKRIGAATVKANSTIPSAFGRSIPNIAEDRAFFTAEAYLVWFTLYAPILLRESFRHRKYYKHLRRLISIIQRCTAFRSTAEERNELRRDIVTWYEEYEAFFYQGKKERLPACLLTVHGWLHVVDLIERSGPLWAYWCWVMERFCGRLARFIKSRKHPYTSMTKRILETARITAIAHMYNIEDRLKLSGSAAAQAEPENRRRSPEYPDIILHTPCKTVRFDSSEPDLQHLKRNISVHLATQWDLPVDYMTSRLPNYFEQYSKIELVDGDVITSTLAHREEKQRDATHLQYELLVDRLAHRPRASPDFRPETFYGRLDRILSVDIAPDDRLPITELKTFIFCEVRQCDGVEDRNGLFEYADYVTHSDIIDAASVRAVIGRIQDAHRWVVVKREGGIEHADYLSDL